MDMCSIAEKTAQILIETKAILFRFDTPFVLTSGAKSPVYVDCRKLIAFADARQDLMRMGSEVLKQAGIANSFDVVAGGETAGIPYGAWMADVLHKPMAYIRKKPKGFGRGARIEGNVQAGDNVLLVEDMTTDGGSKISFVEGIRDAGATCHHCFVVFSYGIFPEKITALQTKHGVILHHLATWADVIKYAEKTQYFKNESDLNSVKHFLANPQAWRADNG